MDIYDLFFSLCLGLFIGGIILSIISIFLAEVSAHDSGADQVDHVDHIDQIDHFDHVDHVDHIDQIDHFDHVDHVDHIDHIDQTEATDHIDQADNIDNIDNGDDIGDTEAMADVTPAPFMLVLSTTLLVFGISGIISYYLVAESFRFVIFIIAPLITYVIRQGIKIGWKKMAKSRYYSISSTQNLIGREGEVILDVDERGGVIKIKVDNPMGYEKVHVRPLNIEKKFEREEKVWVCDVKGDFFLVDNDKSLIRRKRGI